MNAGSEQARVADAEEAGTCGGCGQPLTRRGPSGECLRCLMGFALSPDPDVEPGGDARRATTSGALRYGHFEVAIGADGRPIAGPKNAPTLHPPLYPSWQEYFRKHQPPMLIVWGKNDFIFPPEGAHPYSAT